MEHKRAFFILFLVSCVLLIPFLGYSYIQPTTDLWLLRSVHFYYAVKSYNFQDTYTMYHPGVTVMWLVGITSGLFYKIRGGVDIFSFDIFSSYIFWPTLAVVMAEILALLLLFNVLKIIIGQKTAFISCLILVLEPFFLGNARSIHMDTLVSLFSFISLCYFFLGIKKGGKSNFVFSGIALGFGMLTRINAGVVFAFYIFWIGFLIFWRKTSLTIGLKALLITGIIGALTFYILFPAMWLNPIGTATRILKEGVFDTALAEESRRGVLLALGGIPLLQKVLAYPIYLLFRITPLLFLMLGVFAIWGRKRLELSEKVFIRYLFAFVIYYYLFITIPDKQIFRYALPLLPALAVIAGFTLTKLTKKGLVVGYFAVQLVLVLYYYPNFFAFFNPLLGGIKTASSYINLNQDATGYAVVADYLNRKEGSDKLTLAMYDSNSFKMIFKGQSFMIKTYESQFGKKVDTDYILFPINMGLEFLPKDMYNLEKIFKVAGADYYFLYRRI